VHAPLDILEGQTVRVASAEFEVMKITRRSVELRWTRSPEDSPPPEVLKARGPRLPEVGLHALPGGAVIGVGKVMTLAKRDGSPARVVSLSLFPPGYARDPMQDYELLPRVVAGKVVGGRVRKIEVVALEPAKGSERGWVRIRLVE
jgi:hypothetical protein